MAEPSVATLFSGLLNPNQARQATSTRDLAMGEMLANAPSGRASLLFAPQQVTAAGRLGRRLAGQDPRTQQEIEAEENRTMFQKLSQEAQQRFPNDRTGQLNFLADQLNAQGKVAEAQKARALAQQSQLTSAKIASEQALMGQRQAKQQAAQAETVQTQRETELLGRLEPDEVAGLYKTFNADSIEAYLAGTGPLVPLDRDKREALSTYGKQLVDAGYEVGSAQYEAQMRVYNQRDLQSVGQVKTVDVMEPMEQVGFLKDSIESDPLFKSATVREDKINLAQAALPQARQGSAEGITTLQRTLSDLFNSDTRAASEIQRFVDGNKSLLRAFNDLLSVKIYGELSTSQLENYEAILDAVIKATKKQRQDVLDKNITLFENSLDEKSVEMIKNQYGQEVGSVDNDPLGLR